VYAKFVDQLTAATRALRVGDPTERGVFLGPVINRKAYQDFKGYNEEISEAGTFLTGGRTLTQGESGKGFFCEPTIAGEVPLNHRLWKHEMFLPITFVHAVDSLEEALHLSNDVQYGLTAGFYGSDKEVERFFDQIQAGVTYANRPQGATTGAWPGFQPFGGWKGSGSTGKNAGGHYYVQEYMREQIRTLIR
jgi:1-pyrroline-5-carboxylate dehydrogenase